MEPQNNQPNGEQPEHSLPVDSNNQPESPSVDTPTSSEVPAAPVPSEPQSPTAAPSEPAIDTPAPEASQTAAPSPASSPAPMPLAPENPTAPALGQVVSPAAFDGVAQPGAVVSGGSGKAPRKRKWLLPVVIAVVLLLLLGGGYLFAFYLPNQPGAVYATSLTRTGEGVDAITNYSNEVSKKGYKSTSFTGTITSTGDVSFDGSLNGSADVNGNGSLNLTADVVGEKMNANIDSVHVANSKTPDIYVQLTGIKKELDGLGLNALDTLDGKWIAIDHTLINTYVAQVNKQASGLTSGSVMPTTAQVQDAVNKMQAVNKQYIFTTDATKAVLANEKFIGKETKDGRLTYHYTVSYNKTHLKSYVSALGTALDSSSLNSWVKATNSGKSLSQTIDINSLEKSVSNAKPGYSFDLWVDAKTKLVHAVSFADPNEKGAYFTISQNYTGGTTYPFAIHSYGKDTATGKMETSSVDVAIDTKTDAYKGSLTDDEGKSMHIAANFTLTPSKNTVSVKAPAGAEPVINLLAQLGLKQ